jgi:hypothetical protein
MTRTRPTTATAARVAGDEDYEVQYLTEKTGISAVQARDLIKRHGNDRETLEREAKKIRR